MACIAEQWFDMTEVEQQFEYIIVGLGKTGLSCARYLQQRGVSFAITDSRLEPPMLATLKDEMPGVLVKAGMIDQDLIGKAKEILLSPGISLTEPSIQRAIENGVPVLGDVELFCRTATAPILAVTGSNGKSTVVTLLAEMIKAAGLKVGLGGNIGRPVLELLSTDKPDVYVLELSSFQLETTYSLNAKAAVILNISEDHMDRYDSLEDYTKAKSRIYSGNGEVIMNLDDPQLRQLTFEGRTVRGFSQNSATDQNLGLAEVKGEICLMQGDEVLLSTEQMKIKGQHNHLNALAAIAMGQAINLPEDAMMQALINFKGLTHRCEWVCQVNGVDWYNDSKGTNVGASCAAIFGLAGNNNVILIAGGEGKGADFTPLAKIASGRIKTVITIGRDANKIEEAVKEVVNVERARDLENAVERAFAVSKPGDIVLLSPACASFDMFKDYQERGRTFIDAIQSLRVC